MEEKIRIEKWSRFGSYAIIIKYKGKEYTTLTSDWYAVNAAKTNEKNFYFKGKKEALRYLYDECLYDNRLGKYAKYKETKQ